VIAVLGDVEQGEGFGSLAARGEQGRDAALQGGVGFMMRV
jgi:hypothetical protein